MGVSGETKNGSVERPRTLLRDQEWDIVERIRMGVSGRPRMGLSGETRMGHCGETRNVSVERPRMGVSGETKNGS